MRTAPDDILAEDVAEALGRHWGLGVARLDYLPVGGGAYHWVAEGNDERRWFATCDDLDTKPWLGSDREAVFTGVLASYQAAVELRRRAGLHFVVAPVPSGAGLTAVRLKPRYGLALFPFVRGEPGHWGEPIDGAESTRIVELLAALHGTTWAANAAPRRGIGIPGRQRLSDALEDLDLPWEGGPFSELARQELARHKDMVVAWLAEFDRLASRPTLTSHEPVVTHGEPHPGNLIRTENGFALVDWDTVALDRPERDLWMFDDGTETAWAQYRALTGHKVDRGAVQRYRLAWALSDLAAFTSQLRSPHTANADTKKAWRAIRRTLAAQEPVPYGEAAIGRS